jgi:hypothetical protein
MPKPNHREIAQKALDKLHGSAKNAQAAHAFGYSPSVHPSEVKKCVLAKRQTAKDIKFKQELLLQVGLNSKRLIKFSIDGIKRLVEEAKNTFGEEPQLITITDLAKQLHTNTANIRALCSAGALHSLQFQYKNSPVIIYLNLWTCLRQVRSKKAADVLMKEVHGRNPAIINNRKMLLANIQINARELEKQL